MNMDDGSIFQYSIQRCIVGNIIYSLTSFIRVVPLHKTNTTTELVYCPWNYIYGIAKAIICHIICVWMIVVSSNIPFKSVLATQSISDVFKGCAILCN